MQTRFKSNIKCPHCKSTNLYLNEWVECTTQFHQVGGVVDTTDTNNEPGNTFKVTAECEECGHIWRVRNMVNMVSIINV